MLQSPSPTSSGGWALAGRALDTPEARARVNKLLQDQIALIPDRDLGFRYREDFRQRLRLPWQGRGQGGSPAFIAAEGTGADRECARPGGQGTAQVRERTLLQTLLDFPALVIEQQETLARNPPRDAAFRRSHGRVDRMGRDRPERRTLRCATRLRATASAALSRNLRRPTTHYLNRAASLDDARNTLAHALELQRLRIELPATLSEAEKALADETSEENWERFQEAIRRKRDMEKVEMELPDESGAPDRRAITGARGSLGAGMPPVAERLTLFRVSYRLSHDEEA